MTKSELDLKLRQVIGDLLDEYDTEDNKYCVSVAVYHCFDSKKFIPDINVDVLFHDVYEPIHDQEED